MGSVRLIADLVNIAAFAAFAVACYTLLGLAWRARCMPAEGMGVQARLVAAGFYRARALRIAPAAFVLMLVARWVAEP
jgi:hypothetical protein